MRRTKIGDVFEIKLNGVNRYIQYLARDKSLLDGDIIRCFKYKGPRPEEPYDSALLGSGILFFAHTYLNVGRKIGIWTNIGNMEIEPTFEMPAFRGTNDTISHVAVSENWFIWKPGEERKRVGKLTGELRNLPYGAVCQPQVIKDWARTGKSTLKKPD